jgi:lupus La protein
LPRDKFLQEQIKLEDGWVPLEVILKFKRLSDLTTDSDVVVTALEASELMEVRTRFILLNETSILGNFQNL